NSPLRGVRSLNSYASPRMPSVNEQGLVKSDRFAEATGGDYGLDCFGRAYGDEGFQGGTITSERFLAGSVVMHQGHPGIRYTARAIGRNYTGQVRRDQRTTWSKPLCDLSEKGAACFLLQYKLRDQNSSGRIEAVC